MADYVLGERRRERRTPAVDLAGGFSLSVPGMRGLEVVDASASSVRVRTTSPLRPGRTLPMRVRPDAQRLEKPVVATVLRCSVYRLGRSGVTYEAVLQMAATTGL
jgi:hypothetical protein